MSTNNRAIRTGPKRNRCATGGGAVGSYSRAVLQVAGQDLDADRCGHLQVSDELTVAYLGLSATIRLIVAAAASSSVRSDSSGNAWALPITSFAEARSP